MIGLQSGLVLATLLQACTNHSAGSDQITDEGIDIPQFSAKKGLHLPETTRQSLGVKIVEVTEQRVTAKVELSLRIYHIAEVSALASGFVTPTDAKRLKTGQTVQFRSVETESLVGKISTVSKDLEQTADVVEVLVQIPNPPGYFAIGGFLNGTVTLDAVENVATIPRTALLQCSEGSFVYTVSGNNLVRTAVKVGASNRDLVEIKDGLYSGDQVVSQAVLSLWLTELAAVKGGQSCCIEPPKAK